MNNPQEQIRDYLKARGIATSVELKNFTWAFTKAITRLNRIGAREGFTIISRKVKGKKYNEYIWYEGQIRLLLEKENKNDPQTNETGNP